LELRGKPDFSGPVVFRVFEGAMAILKVILLLLVGGAGIAYSVKHLRRNWIEMRGKSAAPKDASDPLAAHRSAGGAVGKRAGTGDLIFNYGLSFLWFGYLFAFFAGLIVNNLLFR
jgi:hypothetical protein